MCVSDIRPGPSSYVYYFSIVLQISILCHKISTIPLCFVLSCAFILFSFSFGNLNLDDLFGDDDGEHENGMFSEFFGGGDSFFGNMDHMRQVHTQQRSQNCRTVRKQQGNTISTYTTCSSNMDL